MIYRTDRLRPTSVGRTANEESLAYLGVRSGGYKA